LRRPHVHGLRVLLRPRIYPNINGRIQTICNRLADQTDLHDRVVTTLLAHVEKSVLGIGSLHLLVGVVRGCLFDFTEEVLLDVELADVRDCAALDSVVGEQFGAVVDDSWVKLVARTFGLKWLELTVEMVCATYVVTWDHGFEGSCTVLAGRLDTTKCIGRDGGGRAVTVTLGLHASVDTGRIAAPQLYISIGNRLAPRRIDHVDVEMGDRSLLACEDVGSNKLAGDPYIRLV
jgi:hypothetical protein